MKSLLRRARLRGIKTSGLTEEEVELLRHLARTQARTFSWQPGEGDRFSARDMNQYLTGYLMGALHIHREVSTDADRTDHTTVETAEQVSAIAEEYVTTLLMEYDKEPPERFQD